MNKSNLVSKFSASVWSLVRKKNDNLAIQYEDCPWIDKLTSENKEVSYEHILTLMCQSLQGSMQSVVVFFNE